MCYTLGCSRRGVYGIPGIRGRYCSVHRGSGMINMQAKRCTYPGCSTIATFYILGRKPDRCAKHREERLKKDVIRKRGKKRGIKEYVINPQHRISIRSGRSKDKWIPYNSDKLEDDILLAEITGLGYSTISEITIPDIYDMHTDI